MKKIIAAFDGLKYAEGTREYAIYIAKQTNAHLVGVFIEDFTYNSYSMLDLMEAEGSISSSKLKALRHKDIEARNAAVEDFEKKCAFAKLNFTIHRDKNFAIKELLHESSFADLLIINSEETFTHFDEKAPTQFIRDLLSDILCPVIIVPKKIKSTEKINILYDGKPSSVHAIKMFSYLLTPLKHLPTEVITVKNNEQDFHLPDGRLMKEFMKRHFPKATYKLLKGAPEKEITSHLKEDATPAIIVTGAYNRGTVSRWFKQSMADYLLKEFKLPIFIAHNR